MPDSDTKKPSLIVLLDSVIRKTHRLNQKNIGFSLGLQTYYSSALPHKRLSKSHLLKSRPSHVPQPGVFDTGS